MRLNCKNQNTRPNKTVNIGLSYLLKLDGAVSGSVAMHIIYKIMISFRPHLPSIEYLDICSRVMLGMNSY